MLSCLATVVLGLSFSKIGDRMSLGSFVWSSKDIDVFFLRGVINPAWSFLYIEDYSPTSFSMFSLSYLFSNINNPINPSFSTSLDINVWFNSWVWNKLDEISTWSPSLIYFNKLRRFLIFMSLPCTLASS